MGLDVGTSLVLIAGAFILTVGVFVGFRIGRIVTERDHVQLRTTAREMMDSRYGLLGQLRAARDIISQFMTDARTRPHDKLFMEEKVVPLLTERKKFEDKRGDK